MNLKHPLFLLMTGCCLLLTISSLPAKAMTESQFRNHLQYFNCSAKVVNDLTYVINNHPEVPIHYAERAVCYDVLSTVVPKDHSQYYEMVNYLKKSRDADAEQLRYLNTSMGLVVQGMFADSDYQRSVLLNQQVSNAFRLGTAQALVELGKKLTGQ